MKIEIRSDSQCVVSGYVNAVERESRILCDDKGEFVEVVKAGTFSRALSRGEPVGIMFDHMRWLGSTEDILELEEDAIGLKARATINDPEVVALARDNKLTGWSFGFRILDESWDVKPTGMRVRSLQDIELFEVSILDLTPAYIATSVEARDTENSRREFRSIDSTCEVSEADVTVESEKETSAEGETASADVASRVRTKRLRFLFDYSIMKGKCK